MTSTLAGRTIVITRALAQSAELVRQLARAGAVPVVCPAIAILPTDGVALRAALELLSQYDGVVFTSANAVNAVFDQVASRPSLRATLATRRIAAVGPATAAALGAQGLHSDVIPADPHAAALVAALGKVNGQRILLPRSDLARELLPVALRARGATVDEVVAYRTVPAPSLSELPAILRDRCIDALIFASPSAVRFAVDILGDAAISLALPAERPAIVCIGPVTAAEARRHDIAPDAVAKDPGTGAVISALERWFAVARPAPAGPPMEGKP